MFGIVILVLVVNAFIKLAKEYHKKNTWLYGLLAVATYYAMTFAAGIIIGIIMEVSSPGSVHTYSDLQLGLFALPFGIISLWGLYRILKNRWSNNPAILNDENILDAE